jgi:lactate dehydrogenase-like 2-hydroxyacid dehydrogenase
MKILIIADKQRYLKYMPQNDFISTLDIHYVSIHYTLEDLKPYFDSEVICIDAIGKIDRNILAHFNHLKLIQSDGVGFNGIDIDYCKEHHIYVCNCRGANASSVAQHTIMLMLNLLKRTLEANDAVKEGKQIEKKHQMMQEGILDLSDCKIGLIGFGAIAQNLAYKLIPFDSHVVYYDIYRNKDEQKYHVEFNELDDLIQTCDIISLHCPPTKENIGMINKQFIDKMKDNSYIVNTARGELINNQDLYNAIISGKLAGVALDTISPEPVLKDHILLNLDDKYKHKILFTPHIAGVTTSFFKKSQSIIWNNIQLLSEFKKPQFIVNGL